MKDEKEEEIGTKGKIAGWLLGLVAFLILGVITGIVIAIVE